MTSTHPSNLPWFSFAGLRSLAEYRTIRRTICYSVSVITVFAASACGGAAGDGGGEVTPPPPPTNLTFSLQQVNGQSLPASFQPPDGKLVITSGTMLLKVDKSFAENIIYNFTPTGGTAAADTAITLGTYVQTGTDVVFTVPPSGSEPITVFNGTLSGNTLSYNDAGFVAVYQR